MNFYKAAEVLLEVWLQAVIDGYPVECNAVPIGRDYIPQNLDPTACCSQLETSWLTVLSNRFIPFSAICKYAKHSMDAVKPSVYFKSPDNYLNFALLFKHLFMEKISSRKC